MIRFEQVYQTYRSKEDAVLKGIDLHIPQGQFCVLLGKSGMGKSTLMRCINGLVQPYAGQILIDGQPLRYEAKALRQTRRRIAMIFQHYNIVNRLTVLENVVCGMLPDMPFYRSLLGNYPQSCIDQAMALLEQVGLTEFAKQRADRLSGGQKQRVGIARALAQKPDIILADEPVASLDPASSEEILSIIEEVCAEQNITAVVSLHQVEYAKQFGQNIVALVNGKVAVQCTADRLTEETIRRIYQAPPLEAYSGYKGATA